MKVLITGAEGFVGRHLARHLDTLGDMRVVGTTYFPVADVNFGYPEDTQLVRVDLTDEQAVHALLDVERPDHIYHLAAQSYVPESFENPWHTLGNNIRAELNILHSLVKLGLSTRILIVGSAEEYGAVSPDDIPVDEDCPLRPASPYSVSKVTQDVLGLQYYLSHDLPVIRVRPFNHIGPGQSDRFVAPAFASQIAAIERGSGDPIIHVGNLEARRDFTDVRDMVRAYQMVMAAGDPGDVYNIGSGEAHSIQEMLDILLDKTDVAIRVQPDPARMRPVEVPIVVCNNARVRKATGWTTTISFEQTLSDILDDWRSR